VAFYVGGAKKADEGTSGLSIGMTKAVVDVEVAGRVGRTRFRTANAAIPSLADDTACQALPGMT
jgi:hypothetical protein